MIVAREETSQTHLSTGIWGRVTLDQVLEKNARTKPDKLAIVDFADRTEWTGGEPRRLTFAELDGRVETLAAFFAGLGLQPDTVIGVQMPPTSDAVIVFFAALRAGLIVAPLPLAWREAEVIDALTKVSAKAIVTVAAIEGDAIGERLRGVAGELFQIRFVFAAGGHVPDGLIDLDRVFAEGESLGAAPNLVRKGNAADHAATVGWSVGTAGADDGGVVPLIKSHNHWIACGLMTLLEARIDHTAVILSPFALSSVLAIGGVLVPWLLACGTLVTGLPMSVDAVAEVAVAEAVTHVVAPQRFARRIVDRLDMHRHEAMILVARSDRPAESDMPRGQRAVDLTSLGEIALVARRRVDPAIAQSLPVGVIGSPSDTDFAPLLIETRIKATAQRAGDQARGSAASGELLLRGPMTPEFRLGPGGRLQALGAADDWLATGVSVQVVSLQPPQFELRGSAGETLGQGPAAIDLRELDRLYQGIPGIADAAAVPYPTADSGRIAAVIVPRTGVVIDRKTYIAAIEAACVAPHKVPVEVFAVPSIARSSTSDRVMRSGMAARLAASAPDKA
jgi:acyl-CoA synthetase (AMP-forming)/AMP-acid ligase II